MNVSRIILRTVFLSAFIVGLAGAFKITSSAHTLSDSITGDVGWTGIVVAWLGQLSPLGILLVAFLLAVLQFGISTASSTHSNLDANFADLLQGVILFAVLAVHFLINYKIVVNTDKFKAKKIAKLKLQGFEIIDLTLNKNSSGKAEDSDNVVEVSHNADDESESLAETQVCAEIGKQIEGGKE